MTFKPFAPTEGRRPFENSIADLFRRIMPAPFRIKNYATTDLPEAADYKQGLVYDETLDAVKVSDGADWLRLSEYDADVAAIGVLTGTGLLARTADNTWALRSIAAPAAGITVTNPAGVAGNPTLALANDLSAVEGLSGTGIAARTATDTWTTRTITGTSNEITVTNGSGVSGNPTLSLPTAMTFTGKTVNGGTFTGITDIAVADGGTGASDAATARTNLEAEKNFTVFRTGEGSRTLALTDAFTMIAQAAGAVRNYTIPANATVAFPIGTRIWFSAVATTAGFNLIRAAGVALWYNAADADRTVVGGAMLTKTNTNEWNVFGSGIT